MRKKMSVFFFLKFNYLDILLIFKYILVVVYLTYDLFPRTFDPASVPHQGYTGRTLMRQSQYVELYIS